MVPARGRAFSTTLFRPSFAGLLATVAVLIVTGCKVELQAPPGTRIYSESGSYECPGGQFCTIDIADTFFDETFRIETAPGMYAEAWAEGPGYLCGGATVPCRIAPGALRGNTAFENYLAISPAVFPIRAEQPNADVQAGQADSFAPEFSASNTVAILQQRNYSALTRSLALTETVLGFTRTLVQRGVEAVRTPVDTDYSCSGEGSIFTRLEDRDSSLTASAGDVLLVELRDCLDRNLNLYLTGHVTVSLFDLAVIAGGIKLEGEIDYRDGISYFDVNTGDNAEITGAHSFRYAIGSFARNPRGGATGGQVLAAYALSSQSTTIGTRFASDTLSDYSLTRYAADFGGYTATIDTALRLDSDARGGRTSGASHQLLGLIAGFHSCFDQNGAAIRMNGATREIDELRRAGGQYNSTGVTADRYTAFLRGSLFSGIEVGDQPDRVTDGNEVSASVLSLAASDAVYDAVGNRVLFANPDSQTGGRVVAFDPSREVAADLIELSDSPSRLALSNDGQYLHIAFEQSGRIATYRLATLQRVHEHFYDSAAVLTSFMASPVTSNEFMISLRWESGGSRPFGSVDVQIVREGQVLPGSYRSLSPGRTFGDPDEVVYLGDGGALLGVNTAGTPNRITLMTLGSGGIQTLETSRRTMGRQIVAVGDAIYSSSGMFTGRGIDKRANLPGGQVWAFDADENAMYVLGTSRISRYRLDHLQLQGEGEISLRNTSKVISAGDYLFALRNEQVLRIEKADITDTSLSVCEGFIGLDAQGYREFDCDVQDIVYHAATDKLIAATGRDAGSLGASILVLDRQTLEIERSIPITMEPVRMAVSGSGQFVYAVSRFSEQIARVDLESNAVSFISVNDFGGGFVTDRVRPDALYSSPTEADTVVLELGDNSSCAFAGFRLLRNGLRLPTGPTRQEVLTLTGNASFCDEDTGGFDDDGSFYGYFQAGTQGNSTLIPTVFSDEGITATGAVSTEGRRGVNSFEIAIGDGRFFDSQGRETMLGDFNWLERFTNEAIETPSYYVREILVEPEAQRIHYMGISNSGRASVYTHDLSNGALLSTTEYSDPRTGWSDGRKLVATPGEIGILTPSDSILKLAPRSD